MTPVYDVLLGASLSALLPLAMASLAVYCGTGLVALPLVVLPPAPQRCARRAAQRSARALKATARASPRTSPHGASASPRMRRLEFDVVVARAAITQLERETSDLLSSTSWRGIRPSGAQRERRDALRAKLARAHDALKVLEAEARAADDEEEEWSALMRTGDVCATACVRRCCSVLRQQVGAPRLARETTAVGAYGAGAGATRDGGGDDVDGGVGDGDGDSIGYAYDDDMPLPTVLAEADARAGASGFAPISSAAWLARALCGGGVTALALLLVLAVAGAGLERVLQPANFAYGGLLAQSLPRARASSDWASKVSFMFYLPSHFMRSFSQFDSLPLTYVVIFKIQSRRAAQTRCDVTLHAAVRPLLPPSPLFSARVPSPFSRHLLTLTGHLWRAR